MTQKPANQMRSPSISPGDVIFKIQSSVSVNEMGIHGISVKLAPSLSKNQI